MRNTNNLTEFLDLTGFGCIPPRAVSLGGHRHAAFYCQNGGGVGIRPRPPKLIVKNI